MDVEDVQSQFRTCSNLNIQTMILELILDTHWNGFSPHFLWVFPCFATPEPDQPDQAIDPSTPGRLLH